MKSLTLDRWVWVLIYVGAFLAMHGLWSIDSDAGLGWAMLGLGIATAALGVGGIVWRARMEQRPGADASR